MKYKEIAAKALSEATGRPYQNFIEGLNLVKDQMPTELKIKLDQDFPEETAKQLLEAMRADKHGFLEWVQEGAQKIMNENSGAKGVSQANFTIH